MGYRCLFQFWFPQGICLGVGLLDVSLSELGVGDGQGGLACSDSWGCKESDTTE